MGILKIFIQVLAAVSGLTALMSILFFVRLRWPAPVLWFFKLYASALSPMLIFIGMLTTIGGLATDSLFISLIGSYVVLIFLLHLFRVTRPPDSSTGFEQAFGRHWESRIPPKQKAHFLPTRTVLRLLDVPAPRLEQNISFATIPGTDRKLLCDIWQPNKDVMPSGLAFIYLHGSAWYFLDKDLGTRPFFRHLAAQGHVIMDVAYRLAPETDLMGMVHDVKRAIVWMKEHADTYGVNPSQIVVGGGSAGGHLALLAACTDGNPQFTPADLKGKNLSVRAEISLYGPTDLEAMYYHTNQHLTTRLIPGRPKKGGPKMPKWIIQKMGLEYYRLHMDKEAVTFAPLLGGHPDECRERYELFSPVAHVHPHCPPTLLIHGEHDLMAPVVATRTLYNRLVKAKVPTVLHIIPQTDHAFDLILPNISPPAHNAIYDVERFLALMVMEKLAEAQITATAPQNLYEK